ncbi:MAG: hypothetical protein LRY67_07315 [Gammaproteobacteria bacterium]|nr:hypothetical protein [Gammaproteobacteria bacterium]
MSNFKKSESYQHIASVSQEHAATIDANASQDFTNWLSQKPMKPGERAMGYENASKISIDPQQAQYFASQYVREKTSGYIESFKDSNKLSNKAISDFGKE